MIYCANPKAQYLSYKDKIDTAINKVLDSGIYVLGSEVSAFEEEFADYLKVASTVSCGSGTDALLLALKALDIGQGDEVIVPSHTAVPTVAAVVMAGATPVYADIETDYYTIDPERVEESCTTKTKAIIAVHLYGQSAAMNELLDISRRRNLSLIEDCAQAVGASYDGKKLGTIGDVGAIACDDENLAKKIKRLRQYGWDQNRVSIEPGVNSRLDELQAAILRVKLGYLDHDNNRRTEVAKAYSKALAKLSVLCPNTRINCEHVYHQYVIQIENRDNLLQHMKKAGVYAGIHYPVPAHRMPGYACDTAALQYLGNTEHVVEHILSLPIYPEMETSEFEQVITSINEYYYGN